MSKDKEIKQAYKQIEILTKEARVKLEEAEKIADKFGLEFTFDLVSSERYRGKGYIDEDLCDEEGEEPLEEGEWINSSTYC